MVSGDEDMGMAQKYAWNMQKGTKPPFKPSIPLDIFGPEKKIMWIHEPDLKKRPTNPIQQEVYWTHRKHVRHMYLQYIYTLYIYIVHTSPQRLLSWAPTCSLRVSAWSCMIHDSVLFCTVLVHSELTNRFVTLESDFLPRTRTSDPTPNITLPFILPWVLFFFRKERNPAVKPVGILTAGPLFFQTKKYQLKTPCLSGNHLPASTKQESYFSTSKVKPSILKWRFITPSQRMKLSEIRLTTQHAWNHVQ